MTIQVGDRLPEFKFKKLTPEGPGELSTSDVFGGKRVVLFAVPGAYTPTCHLKHLPGFIENADAFKANGIDEIVCIAVNDMFVLSQWEKDSGGTGKVLFLSDGNAEFTKAIGLDFDGSAFGLGTRSQRYAMLVEDGVVKILSVEDAPSNAEVTSAEEMIRQLGQI